MSSNADKTSTTAEPSRISCACPSRGAFRCIAIRYGEEADWTEACECICHEGDEDE
jgi:hypothetical protein